MSIIHGLNLYFFSPLLCGTFTVCGVYFLFKLKLYSPKTVSGVFRRSFSYSGDNGISPFSSLSVALAGTLGVGNISGVAVAISLGGAGAVFWMLVSALLGASLKYAEAYLAVKHRCESEAGNHGGAPYYIRDLAGVSSAKAYAVLCVVMSITSGSFVQTNAASSALNVAYGVPGIVCGMVFSVLCAAVVFGGVKRVSAFASALMPLFCLVFTVISLLAIFSRIELVPSVLLRILRGAFGFRAVCGGAAGAVFSSALRHGITKGVFSNEAGCGTSAFSHAASSSKDPAGQGGVGIIEVLFDTVFFGLLSAFVILLSPAGDTVGNYDGTFLSVKAYSYFFDGAAVHIITALIVFFAAATVICWAYYGTEAVIFLGGGKTGKAVYLTVYCLSLTVGSVAAPALIWEASDIISSVMLTLNCAVLIKGRSGIKEK